MAVRKVFSDNDGLMELTYHVIDRELHIEIIENDIPVEIILNPKDAIDFIRELNKLRKELAIFGD